MMFTLHRYIFREQLKVLALTLTALVVVVVLCGGLLNVVRSYGVELGEVLTMTLYLIPVAVTFVLPFAALFSTTAVYGRMSYDNEITACRAGGVNIARLFLSAIIIGILATAFTTYSFNFMIPSFIRGLDRYYAQGIEAVLFNKFRNDGYMKVPGTDVVVYADKVQDVTTQEQRTQSTYEMQLTGGAILEFAQEQLTRYGTVAGARLRLELGGPNPQAWAILDNPQGRDLVRNEIGGLSMTPMQFAIPRKFKEDVQWYDLPRLLELRRDPAQFSQVQSLLDNVYQRVEIVVLYEDMVSRINSEHKYVIAGPDSTLEIYAEAAKHSPESREPRIEGGVKVVLRKPDGHTVTCTAKRAVINAIPGGPRVPNRDLTELLVSVQVFDDVLREDSEWVALRGPVQSRQESLPVIRAPRHIMERTLAIPEGRLLDQAAAVPENNRVVEARDELLKVLRETRLKVESLIHFRLAFSLGTIWLVVLGAALAIMLRGGHILVALLLGFIPFMVQLILLLAGKTVALHPQTLALGIGLMWFSNAILVVLDVLVLGKFLRR